MADQGLQLRHGLHHLGGHDHQRHAGGVVCQASYAEYNCRLNNIYMISLSNLCILDEYTLCIYLCLFGNLACLPIDYRWCVGAVVVV